MFQLLSGNCLVWLLFWDWTASIKRSADESEVSGLQETIHCHQCNQDSHEHSYVQYFFKVSAASLSLSHVRGGHGSFCEVLRDLLRQTAKSCDTEKGVHESTVVCIAAAHQVQHCGRNQKQHMRATSVVASSAGGCNSRYPYNTFW